MLYIYNIINIIEDNGKQIGIRCLFYDEDNENDENIRYIVEAVLVIFCDITPTVLL